MGREIDVEFREAHVAEKLRGIESSLLGELRGGVLVGPNYFTTDMRLSRKLYAKNGWRIELTAEIL